MSAPVDPLAAFHPTIAGWFADALGPPTSAQARAWPPIEIRAEPGPPRLVSLEVEITGDTAFGDDPDESVLVEWADTEVPLLTASPEDARSAFEVPPGRYRVRALRRREAWGQAPIERGAIEVPLAPGARVRVTLDVVPDAR